MQMLQPSEHLIQQLDRIAPFEKQLVKNDNALVKAANSRKKRAIEEGDGPEDVEQG